MVQISQIEFSTEFNNEFCIEFHIEKPRRFDFVPWFFYTSIPTLATIEKFSLMASECLARRVSYEDYVNHLSLRLDILSKVELVC